MTILTSIIPTPILLPEGGWVQPAPVTVSTTVTLQQEEGHPGEIQVETLPNGRVRVLPLHGVKVRYKIQSPAEMLELAQCMTCVIKRHRLGVS